MKTIEEENYASYKKTFEDGQSTQKCIRNKDYYFSGFEKGVKFAHHWIDVDDELPECNIKGEDDVMLSETVLIKVKNNNDMPVVAIYIKVDDDEFFETLGVTVQQKRITHWRPIELK